MVITLSLVMTIFKNCSIGYILTLTTSFIGRVYVTASGSMNRESFPPG